MHIEFYVKPCPNIDVFLSYIYNNHIIIIYNNLYLYNTFRKHEFTKCLKEKDIDIEATESQTNFKTIAQDRLKQYKPHRQYGNPAKN